MIMQNFMKSFSKEFKNTNNNILEIGAFKGNASAAFFYFKMLVYIVMIYFQIYFAIILQEIKTTIDNSSEKE